MAPKTTDTESPADRVKREMAEKEQREKEAAEAAAKQQTSDKLSAEEQKAVDQADADDAKEAELKRLRNELEKRDKELEGAKKHISALQEPPVDEDPAIAEERRARFARAEEFERQRQLRSETLRSNLGRQSEDIRAGRGRSLSNFDAEGPMTGDGDRVSVSMSRETYDVIYKLATSLPLSTPPEHVMCGYGGIKINVGMIRDMAGVRMR